MANPITRRVLAFAGKLRFPQLFAITTSLFLLDLVVPDMIPFVDEILLGLAALLFGNWRRDRSSRERRNSPER